MGSGEETLHTKKYFTKTPVVSLNQTFPRPRSTRNYFPCRRTLL